MKFSRKIKRSTSKLNHNLIPNSESNISKITEEYSWTPTSPPDILLGMPLIPFWKTSLDLLSLKKNEDATMRIRNTHSLRMIMKKTLHSEDNYMTMKNKNIEEEIVIYV